MAVGHEERSTQSRPLSKLFSGRFRTWGTDAFASSMHVTANMELSSRSKLSINVYKVSARNSTPQQIT